MLSLAKLKDFYLSKLPKSVRKRRFQKERFFNFLTKEKLSMISDFSDEEFIEIAKNKTAVIISHRVGLCKLADRIIVMKDGQICETGTHYDLIEKDGE